MKEAKKHVVYQLYLMYRVFACVKTHLKQKYSDI